MATPVLISRGLTEFPDSKNDPKRELSGNGAVYVCCHCKQIVHRHALGEVLHHEVPNHTPLP